MDNIRHLQSEMFSFYFHRKILIVDAKIACDN